MTIKFLHTVGLTNLSDAEIKKYYEIRRISSNNLEKSSLLERDSESILVFSVFALIVLIIPLLSKCHGGDISKFPVTLPLQDEKQHGKQ